MDALVERNSGQITVLDLSAAALDAAKEGLGARGAGVEWVIADVTTWEPSKTCDLWHDRAVFHFLTGKGDQSACVDRLKKAVKPGAAPSSGRLLWTARSDGAGCRSSDTMQPLCLRSWGPISTD